MFAVICRAHLKEGREADYRKAWNSVARYYIAKRGALGSCLHRGADGLWIAYSRWPDRKTRDATWPGEDAPPDDLPDKIPQAVKTIQDCIDPENKLPEICMELVEDLIVPTPAPVF